MIKYMFQFIETMCHEGGGYPLILYHQERVNATIQEHYPQYQPLQLMSILPFMKVKERIKVRLLYDEEKFVIETSEYSRPSVTSIKLVFDDAIDYSYKYFDRSGLEVLYQKKGTCDDILIVRNGFITDSFYANTVFRKEGKWYTPETCLLEGARRSYLLSTGRIEKIGIRFEDLREYEKLGLINALNDLGDIEIPMTSLQ